MYTLLDKKEIFFNKDGNVINKSKNKKEPYLDMEHMPPKTKEFFNEYLNSIR